MPAPFTLRTAGGLATAVAAIALTLSACSSSTSSSASTSSGSTQTSGSSGTYNIGLITPTGGINPLTTTQYDTMFAVGLASAQLVNESPSGQLKAQLASSWAESADKLSWTFTLRSGLKFSNGQPLAAADVVSTFDAILSPSSQSPAASSSHNLPLVAAHCQRIGVLRHGELVEEGPAAEVLLAPRHPYTRALIAALPDINAARHSGTRAAAVTDRPDLPPGPEAADGPLVTVSNLTKRYDRKTALRDVSFTIGRREVLGLVGESGSGKTTLGLSVAGLTSYEGTISFAVPDRRRGRKVLPRVQVVFQNADASLNPRRTVRRVLGRSIELLGGAQSAEELAARTGVTEDLLDKLPHQLSGGQKQRVAIARAFAGPAPLVICDEPTSALDVSSQARLLDLLAELQDRTGVSYLFISHDLAVVRQVSDRIGVLYDGELVELKNAEKIFTAPEHPYTRSLVDSALSLRRPHTP